MNEPSVSIITPCYNGERYVKETIESVLAQTYTDWEMLVIDDGSQDQSAAIIQSYADKDPRIQLISQENAGSSAARNNGIRRARGRYIALLDADDLWDPEFLSKQIAYLTEKQCVCVYCSYRRINENSQEIGHPTKARPFITTKDMKVMNQIGCLSGLYDREKYGKIYLKEELKSLRDDYAYWYDIVSLEDEQYARTVGYVDDASIAAMEIQI